jgi:hypothetical protein
MLVWYAAYGSNLLTERFLTYLRGGPVPGSGTGRVQQGARNPAAPRDDRPLRIDRVMLFGQESRTWGGGGVCFVDPSNVIAGDTLGRGWLVTAEQLADVWAQENGATAGPEIDVRRLRADGHLRSGQRWYPRLEYLGELDGAPVATITCEHTPSPNAGGEQYLQVVGRGLMETWALDSAAAAQYLASRIGNDGQVDSDALAARLRATG